VRKILLPVFILVPIPFVLFYDLKKLSTGEKVHVLKMEDLGLASQHYRITHDLEQDNDLSDTQCPCLCDEINNVNFMKLW
jgi:hypothetical protein